MNKIVFSVLFVLTLCIPALSAEKRYDIPIGDSPQMGPKEAPVTMIEFLDYQ